MFVFLQEEGHNFGIDWGGPVSYDNSDECITIPETPNPLTRADMAELQTTILNQESSTQYGIDTYEQVLQFVSSKLGCL